MGVPPGGTPKTPKNGQKRRFWGYPQKQGFWGPKCAYGRPSASSFSNFSKKSVFDKRGGPPLGGSPPLGGGPPWGDPPSLGGYPPPGGGTPQSGGGGPPGGPPPTPTGGPTWWVPRLEFGGVLLEDPPNPGIPTDRCTHRSKPFFPPTVEFFRAWRKKSDRPPKIFNHPHRPPLEVNWVVLQPWERIVTNLYLLYYNHFFSFCYRTTVLILHTCDGAAD